MSYFQKRNNMISVVSSNSCATSLGDIRSDCRQPMNLPAVINSITCPEAWGFLYRMCKDGENKGVPDDDLFKAGKNERNKLLHTFVSKCYVPDHDYGTNRARLECYTKLRQLTKDWKTTMKGYEWLTEAEMAELKWSAFLGSNSVFTTHNQYILRMACE